MYVVFFVKLIYHQFTNSLIENDETETDRTTKTGQLRTSVKTQQQV